MPDQQPAVGRVVHYVARGSADGVFPPACRAAIITQAGAWVDVAIVGGRPDGEPDPRERTLHQRRDDQAVWLQVMNPTGTFTHGPMTYDDGHDPAPDSTEQPMCDGLAHTGGTWHWPARV